jgi:hypothetical protein
LGLSNFSAPPGIILRTVCTVLSLVIYDLYVGEP